MKIRLYLDEDSMDQALVRSLRARGVDVITALDANMIERSDLEHLEYATAHGRVLSTFNARDFYQLHTEYLTQEKSHAGIVIMAQQRYAVGEQLRRLLKLIAAKSADAMKDQIEFPSAWEPER